MSESREAVAGGESVRSPIDLEDIATPEECGDWRQADVFHELTSLPVLAEDGTVKYVECERGVAILSQSCDASQLNRQTVQLARVVALTGSLASEARRGRRPRYAPLPGLGDDHFADLDVVATATKNALVPLQRTTGVPDDQHVNRFAATAARKVGRFAFPDPVVEALRPLQDDLFEKSKKTSSPMSTVLGDVRAFRVKVEGDWSATPHEVVVHVILAPGAMPVFEDEQYPEQPRGMRSNLLGGKDINERVAEIVACLVKPGQDDATRYWAWQMLAEAWSARCEAAERKAAGKAGVPSQVATVSVELFVYDEYTLDLVDTTERLDLDYLSPPSPGAGD